MKNKLLIIAVLSTILLVAACVTHESLPVFTEPSNFKGAYKSLVRLETKEGRFFCSATVISDDYALTAAHCMTEDGKTLSMHKGQFTVRSMPNEDGETKVVSAKFARGSESADYALVTGDFSTFSKGKITTSSSLVLTVVGPVVVCGFPWGAEAVCYPTGNSAGAFFGKLDTEGLLFPGMSGGPVIDVGTNTIIAVNSAVGQHFIVIAPLIGLFSNLGIEVSK